MTTPCASSSRAAAAAAAAFVCSKEEEEAEAERSLDDEFLRMYLPLFVVCRLASQ
jgi:hypothetical protein